MVLVALEYFQNPKFHNPSSKIEWITAIWRFELQKVQVLRNWHCRTAKAVPSARRVQISNGLFRMVCMIHKHLLMPWNHIQKFFSVPLLTDWLVEGHLICTVHLISAQTGLEWIESTKAEVLLSNIDTVFESWNPSFYSPSPKFRDYSNKIWTRNKKNEDT